MPQTISTKVLPCTSTKPTRIKATASGGVNITRSLGGMDYANDDDAHLLVAQQLATKLKWSGYWVGDTTKDGFVFVCTGPRAKAFGVG